ncbi:hypothetical protein ACFQ1I_35685 [Kitasatospora arboriphila]
MIERQPVEWRQVVTARLAERRAPGWGWSEHFPLLEYLVRSTGSPVPATDSFTTQWVRERSRPEPRHRAFGDLPPGRDLHARLVADPFTPVLAPRVFEVPDLAANWRAPGSPGTTPSAGPPSSPGWPPTASSAAPTCSTAASPGCCAAAAAPTTTGST